MIKLDLHEVKNASKEEKEFYKISAEYMVNVLNDKNFWLELQLFWHEYEETNNHSFRAYRKLVMSGKDSFNKASDKDIDLYVTLYTSFRSVVGYTTPRTWYTWFNRKFYNKFDYADMAGHIFHEYNHNLGFGHTNANRDSLVYQVGYAVKKHVEFLLKDFDKPKKHKYIPWYKKLFGWLF